jgi:hypothetical protein
MGEDEDSGEEWGGPSSAQTDPRDQQHQQQQQQQKQNQSDQQEQQLRPEQHPPRPPSERGSTRQQHENVEAVAVEPPSRLSLLLDVDYLHGNSVESSRSRVDHVDSSACASQGRQG